MKRSDKFLSKGRRALLSVYTEDRLWKLAATGHTTPFLKKPNFQDFVDTSLPVLSVSLGVKGNSFIAKRTGKSDQKDTGLKIFHKAILSPKFYFSFNCKQTVMEDSDSRRELSK